MPFIDFNTGKRIRIVDGFTGVIHHSNDLTFAHVTIQKNASLPEHNHVHEQWTHVIAGELLFNLNGEKKILTPGEAVFIPSNVPHSAIALTDCKVIDGFLPVREDFLELEREQSAAVIIK